MRTESAKRLFVREKWLPSNRHIDTLGRSTVIRATEIGISQEAIIVIVTYGNDESLVHACYQLASTQFRNRAVSRLFLKTRVT